jgi:hypothetical protein
MLLAVVLQGFPGGKNKGVYPSTWDGFEGTIRLHLNKEAPRVGCGERGLTVSVRGSGSVCSITILAMSAGFHVTCSRGSPKGP